MQIETNKCPKCNGRILSTRGAEERKCINCGWRDHNQAPTIDTDGIAALMIGLDKS